MERTQFISDIRAYVEQFSNTPVGNNCHHEFFLYISGHGSARAFYLYERDGSGRLASGRVTYADLTNELNQFPTDPQHLTTVYVVVDACYAGAMVGVGMRNYGVPPHYAVQFLSVVDRLHTAPAGHTLFERSGTEYFLSVPRRPATMTTGFKSLQNGFGDRNPERFRAPDKEGSSWFKLDP